MKSADRLPEHSIALNGAIAPWVLPVPGLNRFVIISQHLAPPPATLSCADGISDQAASARYVSPRTRIAHTIRAILLARATAATFDRLRSSNRVSQS